MSQVLLAGPMATPELASGLLTCLDCVQKRCNVSFKCNNISTC